MKKGLSFLIACGLLLGIGFTHAQDGSLAKSTTQAPTDTNPVTTLEARNVIIKIQAAMAGTVVAKPAEATKLIGSSKPITREQLVEELDRLSKIYASYYTLKPRTQYLNAKAIKLSGRSKDKAVRLIKLGFMEPVAELAVGPKDTLTMGDFSEAFGFFIERWCDMTHMPSIKYSPELMSSGPTPTKPSGSKVRVP